MIRQLFLAAGTIAAGALIGIAPAQAHDGPRDRGHHWQEHRHDHDRGHRRAGPPAPRHEPPPVARRGYVWAPGSWRAAGPRYVWQAGHWERARPGYRYVPDRWVQTRNGWVMRAGGWVR